MMELLIAGVVILGLGGLLWFFLRDRGGITSNEALMARTFARLLEGETEDVLEEMRRLYQQTGQDVGVGIALGILLRHAGKDQVAIRTHRSLATRNDLEPDIKSLIRLELGIDYLNLGLLDRARQCLEEARQNMSPDDRMANYGVQILTRLGDWDAAVKLLLAWGKAKGRDASERIGLLRFEQGERLWTDGNHVEANAAWKKAIGQHKACLPAILGCSRYLRHSGKPQKSLDFMKKQWPHFKGFEWLGLEEFCRIGIAADNHKIFLDRANDVLANDAGDWRSRVVMATFLIEIGEHEQAGEQLLQALDLAPQVLLVHQRFWRLLMRMRDPRNVFETYHMKVRKDLVFRDPYICNNCSFNAPELLWICPSCNQACCFTERKT